VRFGPKNAASKFIIYIGLVGLVAERKVHRRTLTDDRNVEITGRNLREEALPADGTPSPSADPPDAASEGTIGVIPPAARFAVMSYQHDDERDPDALREARIRELQRRGGAVPDPPHSALGPPADDPYRDNFHWSRRRR